MFLYKYYIEVPSLKKTVAGTVPWYNGWMDISWYLHTCNVYMSKISW